MQARIPWQKSDEGSLLCTGAYGPGATPFEEDGRAIRIADMTAGGARGMRRSQIRGLFLSYG